MRSAEPDAHGFEFDFSDEAVLWLLRQETGTHDTVRAHGALFRVEIGMVKFQASKLRQLRSRELETRKFAALLAIVRRGGFRL